MPRQCPQFTDEQTESRCTEALGLGVQPTVLCFQPQTSPSCSPYPKSSPFPIPVPRECLFQEVFPELRELPFSGTVLLYIQRAD